MNTDPVSSFLNTTTLFESQKERIAGYFVGALRDKLSEDDTIEFINSELNVMVKIRDILQDAMCKDSMAYGITKAAHSVFEDWGTDRFVYTKEQCERVHEYLMLNKRNTARVFACIWPERLFQSRDPVLVVDMIDRVNKWIDLYEDFDTAWDDTRQNTQVVMTAMP